MLVQKRLLSLTLIASAIYLTGCKACTEQHDPSGDHKIFTEERLTANRPITRLTEEGKIPKTEKAGASSEAVVSAGVKKYQQFCASCHGANGEAAGPVAQALVPKPRNLTEAKWQDSVDDARIAKVIKEGGTSVGLSATMAAWGAMISDEEITEIVALIRGFKK